MVNQRKSRDTVPSRYLYSDGGKHTSWTWLKPFSDVNSGGCQHNSVHSVSRVYLSHRTMQQEIRRNLWGVQVRGGAACMYNAQIPLQRSYVFDQHWLWPLSPHLHPFHSEIKSILFWFSNASAVCWKRHSAQHLYWTWAHLDIIQSFDQVAGRRSSRESPEPLTRIFVFSDTRYKSGD